MKCEHKPVDNIKAIKERMRKLQEERFSLDWDAVLEKEKQAHKTLPDLPVPTGLITQSRIIDLYKGEIDKEIQYLSKKLRAEQAKKSIKKGQITGQHVAQAKQCDIRNIISFNRGGYASCLWHNEKSPSLHYNPKKNAVHCFGCGKNADAIDVFMEVHKPILFPDAVRAMISINP